MIAEFRAMGTDWWIRADAGERAMRGLRSLVEEEEQRFSRFRPDSALSVLNRTGTIADRRIARVMRLARRISRETQGAFDPAVGSAMIAAGYDRSFERLAGEVVDICSPAPALPRVSCSRRTVHVRDGAIDLGGIAKGWTVDRAGQYLRSSGCERFVVDAGGDILVAAPDSGGEVVGLDGSDWSVRLRAGAVATSSTLRRRWVTARGQRHHIIDPTSGLPASGRFVTATVVAHSAAVADALATALLADTDRALPALARFEAEAFLVNREGTPVMTPGMERWLS